MKYNYPKAEHLKKETQIQLLFEKGAWCNKFPLKIIYCLDNSSLIDNHKIGVSVSKRNFKRAADRNYIKRVLRECYRLHKNQFNKTFPLPHLVMIIYVGNEILPYIEIEKKYLQLLEKVTR